jgi:hypothetical protein
MVGASAHRARPASSRLRDAFFIEKPRSMCRRVVGYAGRAFDFGLIRHRASVM